MKRISGALLIASFALTASASTAAAQAPGYYTAPPPPPARYAPPPPPVQYGNRWGIGLRSGSMELSNAANEDQSVELEGGGLHLRYRFGYSWSLEAGFDGYEGTTLGGLNRRATQVSLSLLVHLSPSSQWDWYLLGGLGTTFDEIRTDSASVEPDEEFIEQEFHAGLGLQYRWRQFGIGAEVRALSLQRDDTELDGTRYNGLDGPIPYESVGGQATLQGTFYF